MQEAAKSHLAEVKIGSSDCTIRFLSNSAPTKVHMHAAETLLSHGGAALTPICLLPAQRCHYYTQDEHLAI